MPPLIAETKFKFVKHYYILTIVAPFFLIEYLNSTML